MIIKNPPDVQSGKTEGHDSQDNVAILYDAARVRRFSRKIDLDSPPAEPPSGTKVAAAFAELGHLEDGQERNSRTENFIDPAFASVSKNHRSTTERCIFAGPFLIARPSTTAAGWNRHNIVRQRTNAAVRPILEAYGRRHGILSESLQTAIKGPKPLTHPAIVRKLGSALHSEAMWNAIAVNADPALVPFKVYADLKRLTSQNLFDQLPNAVKKAFPDWNKPLVPSGQCYSPWHAKDAAAWLKHFPPSGRLLHPMSTWDGDTAALWLNDRSSILPNPQDQWNDEVVIRIDGLNSWKPSLEVLHNLYPLEREELAYRVFVERLRRDVMVFYVSERKICVGNAITHVTFGYQTLKDARRSVRKHDLRRIRRFDLLFGNNGEWIYDLCCRIVAAYAWPSGFSEPELWFEFPNHDDAA